MPCKNRRAIHPFGLLIIVLGLAVCVAVHSAVFAQNEKKEEQGKGQLDQDDVPPVLQELPEDEEEA